MFGLSSKNRTWNLTAPKPAEGGVPRSSSPGCRLGAEPRTSKRTDPPAAGKRSSQNGATIVAAAVVGSGWLSKPKKVCVLKVMTPLLPMLIDVKPGEMPPNWIGNGSERVVKQRSQASGSTVPLMTGNSKGTTCAGS